MNTIIWDTILAASTEKKLRPNSQHNGHRHDPVVLLYLPHLDCDLCQHTIKELRQIASADPKFSSMILFHPGSVGDGDSIKRLWPGIAIIADQTGRIYRQLPWSEEAFGQCLALTSRLDTAQDYADLLLNVWQLPEGKG